MSEVARRSPAADLTTFDQLAPEDQARVRQMVEGSLAASTRRTYKSHLTTYLLWCRKNGYLELPATDATVAAYLSYLADRPKSEGGPVRPSSIKSIKSAIASAHSYGGYPNPTNTKLVKDTIKGIARLHQGGKVERVRPLTGEDVLAIAGAGTGTYADVRDAAIILVGFGTAMRRSEVVALDVADIERKRDGAYVAHIRSSKTDQTGEGAEAELPREAVTALHAWLTKAGITHGPIFVKLGSGGRPILGKRLTGQAVAMIVKRRAYAAGIAPSQHEAQFSGHSLRRGAATEADANGASEFEIRDLGRWKSMATVGMYVEKRKRIGNLSERLGLKPKDSPTPPAMETT